MPTFYMHLIDGEPATFEGHQICIAGKSEVITLVSTLAQIRREQRATNKWREDQGFTVFFDYSYIRVRTPDDTKSTASSNRGTRKAGTRAKAKTSLARTRR